MKLRHKQWQELRKEISETDSKTGLSQQAQANLNHPDTLEIAPGYVYNINEFNRLFN